MYYSYTSDNRPIHSHSHSHSKQSTISLGSHSSSHSHLYSQDLGFNLPPAPIVPSNAPPSSSSDHAMSLLTGNGNGNSSSSLLGSLSFVGGAYQSAYASSASLKGYNLADSLMTSASGHPHHQSHSQSQYDHRGHQHQHPRTISIGLDQDSHSNSSSGTNSTLMTPAQSLQWSLQGQGRDASTSSSSQGHSQYRNYDDGFDRDTLGSLSGGLSRRSSECLVMFSMFVLFFDWLRRVLDRVTDCFL